MPKDENIKEGHIIPLGTLNNAKIWNKFYKQNIDDKDLNQRMVAIYCLLTSIEMHLKAYLIFLDNKFGEEKNLKKIGHNFVSLYNHLEKNAPKDFNKKVNRLFTNYKFFKDFSMLRYPKKGDRFWVHLDLWDKKQHGFNEIFNFIDDEINKKSNQNVKN